jgi:hypothetical protein
MLHHGSEVTNDLAKIQIAETNATLFKKKKE